MDRSIVLERFIFILNQLIARLQLEEIIPTLSDLECVGIMEMDRGFTENQPTTLLLFPSLARVTLAIIAPIHPTRRILVLTSVAEQWPSLNLELPRSLVLILELISLAIPPAILVAYPKLKQ